MRWKRLSGLLALLLTVTGGCKQRCFMTEADFQRTTTTCLDYMEERPDLACSPLTQLCPPPPTLENLDRKVRFISLAECIAISLENGRVGQANLLFPGTANDNLVNFNRGGGGGQSVFGSDAIRVFAIDPAWAGTNIDLAASKFDAFFAASMQWQTTDQPVGTPLQNFQAQGRNAIQTDQATANLTLGKPLATGGITGITFQVPYQFTNLPSRVNPAYQPALQFQFEQPLLQGFGVEINQLRDLHPSGQGGQLNLGQGLATPSGLRPSQEGLLITRLRFDQQRAEFERQVNQMLLNVEVAYWNLYGAYWTLYSREQGLRFAFIAYNLTKAGFDAGRRSAGEFYQSRGQYELFRAQRLQALDQVLENERQLRSLLGIPIEDGCRLMPSDSPTLAPYQPDWCSALQEALEKRPELYMVRQEIKALQLRMVLNKNYLLPDLRFFASYDINSLGTRLDGSSTQTEFFDPASGSIRAQDINAFRGLTENNFNNWSVGIRMITPLGFRQGHAFLRQAQLDLARMVEILKDQELKAQSYLGNYYRRISTNYEQIRANRAQREAFGEQLRARQQEYIAGRGTLDILLESQRFWADALANEYQSIVQYNNALVGFEFAKGTIQQYNNVYIAEGPLPACAAVRAVDHQRQRTAAMVLREREAPMAVVPGCGKVETPDGRAPTLPAVMAAVPPLKEVPPLPGTIEGMKSATAKPVEVKPEELFTPVPAPASSLPATVPPSGATSRKVPRPASKKARKPSEFGVARQKE